jgi:DNA-binding XRE family transcriptional regulator
MSEELSFGQWLKRRRKMCDLTQVAFARAVPCAVQTIRALESDALRPSRELAVRLACALGVPLHDHESFVGFARGRGGPARWRRTITSTTSVRTPCRVLRMFRAMERR